MCIPDEKRLDHLTDSVYRRLHCRKPRARLIGRMPPVEFAVEFVFHEPFDLLILGILSPGELLSMPTDPVCRALLDGTSVYLWKEQPYRAAKHAGVLRRELAAAEERLERLGVCPIGTGTGWMTAAAARSAVDLGIHTYAGTRMTELARSILEEKIW